MNKTLTRNVIILLLILFSIFTRTGVRNCIKTQNKKEAKHPTNTSGLLLAPRRPEIGINTNKNS